MTRSFKEFEKVSQLTPVHTESPLKAFLDPSLEAELLAGFLQGHKEVIDSNILLYLNSRFFSTPTFSWVAEKVCKYSSFPISKDYLRIQLEEQFEGDDLEKHVQVVLSLYERNLTFVPETLTKFKDYIAFQIVTSTVKSAIESRQRTRSSGFWLNDIESGVYEARSVWEGRGLETVDFASSFLEREKVRKSRRDNPEIFARLRLGIEDFDSQIMMSKGTVTGFLAPFKKFKSVMLCACGFASLLQGFNTLHVVYENTVEMTSNRYDSMFSGLSYDRVVNYLKTTEEKSRINELMDRIDGWPNRLKIVKAIPYKTTVQDIELRVRSLEAEEGFFPDVEIYDYLNLIGPSKSFPEERLRNEQATWDLQNHSKVQGSEKIVVTASQAKVEALSVSRLDASHQGKSIGISQAMDSTVAINQTVEEHRDGLIVLCPLYLRDGNITKEEIVLRSDISRMCVSREMNDLWKEVEW
jgi:hypothetical protein